VLTELSPTTLYHYRFVVRGATGGAVYGQDDTVTTGASPT
jgi:hypothetical protein